MMTDSPLVHLLLLSAGHTQNHMACVLPKWIASVTDKSLSRPSPLELWIGYWPKVSLRMGTTY